MVVPTPRQQLIRDHPGLDLLVVAPAGCGKTEALALRVAGLIERGAVPRPKRILVTTFSNRARDNVRERLQNYLSPAAMRNHVTVTNFHGLSARIFQAHANVIGLEPRMTIPESDWVGEECRRRNLGYKLSGDVQARLRVAKQQPLDDAAVAQLLVDGGNSVAVEIERLRVAEGRLTYDDLPRLAELILANEAVANLYRRHFGAVVVDEFQDLTPQQLRIVTRIGYRRTTYAGDLGQGIYGFAGADPEEVDRQIRSECTEVIEFSESHRSSPAVLAMVNTLVTRTGGTALTSADPGSWPAGGLAGYARFDDVDVEAAWVVEFCQRVLARVPAHRIGVMARGKPRRRFVDALVEARGVPFHRWEDGVLDTDTAKAVKALLSQLSVAEFRAAPDRMKHLREAAGLNKLQDPDSRRYLADALNWCHDLLLDGETPAAIRARIRIGDGSTLLNAAGVHLLTGHIGKGQQFDWVVVVGAEEGTIPDFRSDDVAEEARILSVMISRARHGAVVTHALNVPDNSGRVWSKEPSRFFAELQSDRSLRGKSAVEAWLDGAPWGALAER